MSETAAWEGVVGDALASVTATLGGNLRSVVLYGSAARGDFVAGVSDINLLIVLNESTPGAHEALARALAGKPNVEPFAIGWPGLVRTARAFPAKFSAIRRTGRTIYGPDPLADLPRFPDLERFAAEQALRNVRLRLVYHFIKRRLNAKAYTRFVLNFVPSLYSACNAALELEGYDIPRTRDAQAALFTTTFGADAGVLVALAARKRHPTPLTDEQVGSTHAALFGLVMAALDWVERRWPV